MIIDPRFHIKSWHLASICDLFFEGLDILLPLSFELPLVDFNFGLLFHSVDFDHGLLRCCLIVLWCMKIWHTIASVARFPDSLDFATFEA